MMSSGGELSFSCTLCWPRPSCSLSKRSSGGYNGLSKQIHYSVFSTHVTLVHGRHGRSYGAASPSSASSSILLTMRSPFRDASSRL